jgi:hypothetical protein
MKKKNDGNKGGVEKCDIFRSEYPHFRDRPKPKQQRVILNGCRAWTPRPDIAKGLGYLSDARHNLGG